MVFDVRRFDIYRKIPKDLTQPTLTGAIVSICCCIVILLLFVSELMSFITTELVSDLYVENTDEASGDKITVTLNISLPRLRCEFVGLDIQDDMGRHEVGFVENTEKVEINGGTGCRFEGKFLINKVPGNFHVSTHSADKQPNDIDMAHIIHRLTFGDNVHDEEVQGGFNALGNKDRSSAPALESHEYHLKLVPTIYVVSKHENLYAYQYTSAHKSMIAFSHSGRVIPAVWFRYDLNPITVKYHRRSKPFYSFVTMICAIIGGTFTVAGIIDSLIFTASNIIHKLEIGKLS